MAPGGSLPHVLSLPVPLCMQHLYPAENPGEKKVPAERASILFVAAPHCSHASQPTWKSWQHSARFFFGPQAMKSWNFLLCFAN